MRRTLSGYLVIEARRYYIMELSGMQDSQVDQHYADGTLTRRSAQQSTYPVRYFGKARWYGKASS